MITDTHAMADFLKANGIEANAGHFGGDFIVNIYARDSNDDPNVNDGRRNLYRIEVRVEGLLDVDEPSEHDPEPTPRWSDVEGCWNPYSSGCEKTPRRSGYNCRVRIRRDEHHDANILAAVRWLLTMPLA